MADAPAPTIDMDKRTEQYIQVRDMLKALEKEYDEKRKPWLEIKEKLEGIISSFLDTNKLDTVKTKHGTCYTSTRHTATLADPDAFMRYVVENKEFDLLDRRANASAVREFVEKNKSLPPGCNLNALRSLGVRRGKAE